MAEVVYQTDLEGVGAPDLQGFFVDWPHPPSPEVHFRVLAGSDLIVLAIDAESGRVVGFITALTDGVLSGFIPLLEVLPEFQGQGIGRALMRHMLDRLKHLPNVDLMCDSDIVPFYEKFGMQQSSGMVLRNREALRTLRD